MLVSSVVDAMVFLTVAPRAAALAIRTVVQLEFCSVSRKAGGKVLCWVR